MSIAHNKKRVIEYFGAYKEIAVQRVAEAMDRADKDLRKLDYFYKVVDALIGKARLDRKGNIAYTTFGACDRLQDYGIYTTGDIKRIMKMVDYGYRKEAS